MRVIESVLLGIRALFRSCNHPVPVFIALIPVLYAPADAVVIDGIAAIVNRDIISRSELYELEHLDLRISGLPSRENLLQERIDHHLVLQQLREQPPIMVPDEEVYAAIHSYSEHRGGMEKLVEFLASIGMNYQGLQQEVREQISIRNFITDRFRPFVNITIDDVETYYHEIYKPERDRMGLETGPFLESFPEAQQSLIESRIQGSLAEWLQALRKEATLSIKDRDAGS